MHRPRLINKRRAPLSGNGVKVPSPKKVSIDKGKDNKHKNVICLSSDEENDKTLDEEDKAMLKLETLPFKGAEDYEEEATVPVIYNEDYQRDTPIRILDSFSFYARDGKPTGLDQIGSDILFAYGHVLLPEHVEGEDVGAAAHLPIHFPVDEWCIEFDETSLIWVLSLSGVWYKLLAPHPSHARLFKPVQELFDLCTTIVNHFKKAVYDYDTIMSVKYGMAEKEIIKRHTIIRKMVLSSFPEHRFRAFFAKLQEKVSRERKRKKLDESKDVVEIPPPVKSKQPQPQQQRSVKRAKLDITNTTTTMTTTTTINLSLSDSDEGEEEESDKDEDPLDDVLLLT